MNNIYDGFNINDFSPEKNNELINFKKSNINRMNITDVGITGKDTLNKIDKKLDVILMTMLEKNQTGSGNNMYEKLLKKTKNMSRKDAGLILGFYLNFNNLLNDNGGIDYKEYIKNDKNLIDEKYYKSFYSGIKLSDKHFKQNKFDLYNNIKKRLKLE